MNSSAEPRVPLFCRFIRTRSSYASETPDSRPATGIAARHVARCARCQQYFAEADQFDQQLRRASLRHPVVVPAELEGRIFRAIEPAITPYRRRRSRSPWIWLAVTASGVAAVVAVIQLREQQGPATNVIATEISARPQAKLHADPATPVEPLPVPVWSSFVPSVATLREENPLQREIAAVQSDTRSALRFLARNFLPDDMQAMVEAGDSSGSSS
jgi:hypothetical protein